MPPKKKLPTSISYSSTFDEAERIWQRSRSLENAIMLTHNDAVIEASRLMKEVGSQRILEWAAAFGVKPPARQARYGAFITPIRMMLYREHAASELSVTQSVSRLAKAATVFFRYGIHTKEAAQAFFKEWLPDHPGPLIPAICANFDRDGTFTGPKSGRGNGETPDPPQGAPKAGQDAAFVDDGISSLLSRPCVGRLAVNDNEPPLTLHHGLAIGIFRPDMPPHYDLLRDVGAALTTDMWRALIAYCANDDLSQPGPD